MTKTFNITANTIEGSYEAETADAAILSYVRDAGYRSIEDAAGACNQTAEAFLVDIIVTEVK